MSVHLQEAVYRRLSGAETLTGDALAAQARISVLPWRYGALRQHSVFPCGVFWKDAGTFELGSAPDIGIIENTIWRFELWTEAFDGAWFADRANDLELMFDERKQAPAMSIGGSGQVYDIALFTGMQAPLHEEKLSAYYGLISFRIVEARP